MPKLDEVPDGDWFCRLCEHDRLCGALRGKCDTIDVHYRALADAELLEQQKKLKAQLARSKARQSNSNTTVADQIGAYLDSCGLTMGENDNPNGGGGGGGGKRGSRSLGNYSKRKPLNEYYINDEPLGPRSCRAKTRINYTFDDYDRSIKQALGEELEDEEDEAAAAKSNGNSFFFLSFIFWKKKKKLTLTS